MTRLVPPQGPAVLVSWVSVGARAAPLLSALDVGSPLFGKVQKLYLLWRDAPGSEERVVLTETITALRKGLDPHCPEIARVQWKTTAQPTNHEAIRRFVEPELRRIRDENPDTHVFVHLSPGTPAMHSVWLVLCSTGAIGPPVTMLQGIPPEKREKGAAPIEAVAVEVDTWLRRVRASRPTGQHDDDARWEPTELAPEGAMRRVLRRIEDLAELPAPVLLLGERGTGKTTLANHLRAIGPFRGKDARGRPKDEWQSVVCGQFRGEVTLARSELFGHSKGAYTGATQDRVGRLELAEGDCLFLDEIADIDPNTQRLLIRAVEHGRFSRMGDNAERRSRFRLICATNRSLADLAGGLLDADFFDRIAMFTVEVPPLRACREDLAVFWRAVLHQVVKHAGVEAAGWRSFLSDDELLVLLRSHPLPGNMRDLQRVAWHLVAALHAGRQEADARGAAAATLNTKGQDFTELPTVDEVRARLPLATPLPDQLDALRRRYTDGALSAASGNRTRAAELLGVKRETLKGWLKGSATGAGAPAPGGRAPPDDDE